MKKAIADGRDTNSVRLWRSTNKVVTAVVTKILAAAASLRGGCNGRSCDGSNGSDDESGSHDVGNGDGGGRGVVVEAPAMVAVAATGWGAVHR